jgi:hypothetical protein
VIRALSPLKERSGLDEREGVKHLSDLEQSEDTAVSWARYGKAPTVLSGAVVCFEEQPEPRRIHELEVAQVEDHAPPGCGGKLESLVELWSGGEV